MRTSLCSALSHFPHTHILRNLCSFSTSNVNSSFHTGSYRDKVGDIKEHRNTLPSALKNDTLTYVSVYAKQTNLVRNTSKFLILIN